MIERLRLQNPKSLCGAKLGRLTALVGPNGAGKTDVLKAILDTKGDAHNGSAAEVGFFKFRTADLAAPASGNDLSPIIGSSGRNLPSVLAFLKEDDQQRFSLILNLTQEVIPVVQDIDIRETGIGKTSAAAIRSPSVESGRAHMTKELFFTIAGSSGIPSSEAGVGILNVLALITTLLAPNRPNVVLLDSLEQCLHPLAQRHLMTVIKKIQNLPGNGDLQIILTTHSPYVVDGLDPEDVWIMAMNNEGTTLASRLSEHPELAEGECVLSTGELWSTLGEDWIWQTHSH